MGCPPLNWGRRKEIGEPPIVGRFQNGDSPQNGGSSVNGEPPNWEFPGSNWECPFKVGLPQTGSPPNWDSPNWGSPPKLGISPPQTGNPPLQTGIPQTGRPRPVPSVPSFTYGRVWTNQRPRQRRVQPIRSVRFKLRPALPRGQSEERAEGSICIRGLRGVAALICIQRGIFCMERLICIKRGVICIQGAPRGAPEGGNPPKKSHKGPQNPPRIPQNPLRIP